MTDPQRCRSTPSPIICRRLTALALAVAVVAALAARGAQAVEIRDVVDVKGIRANHLVGYGLAVGLAGTGDQGAATRKALRRFLERAGMTLDDREISGRNTALVVVTAELPPFAAEGQTFDCQVSAIGDATSLAGGRLISTPLHAADPKLVYARAQGTISFSGQAEPKLATSGVLRGGAAVEREVPLEFVRQGLIELALRRADAVLAQAVTDAILQGLNARPGEKASPARAVNTGLIEVRLPDAFKDDPVAFLSEILRFPVDVEPRARVAINQRTGTVAVSDAVRVLPAAFAHGDLTVQIGSSERTGRVVGLESGTSLRELVTQLNRIGIAPRDLIAVLEQLIRVGALHAELLIE